MVFWHGCDIKLRPCLIVRLGLACSTLAYHDRPRFAQAVGMGYSIAKFNVMRGAELVP